MLISLLSVLLNVNVIIVVAWLVVFIIALISLAKRRDMITPVKIFWVAIIFFAPVVGLILYLVLGFRKKDRHIKRY